MLTVDVYYGGEVRRWGLKRECPSLVAGEVEEATESPLKVPRYEFSASTSVPSTAYYSDEEDPYKYPLVDYAEDPLYSSVPYSKRYENCSSVEGRVGASSMEGKSLIEDEIMTPDGCFSSSTSSSGESQSAVTYETSFIGSIGLYEFPKAQEGPSPLLMAAISCLGKESV